MVTTFMNYNKYEKKNFLIIIKKYPDIKHYVNTGK